MSAPDPRYDLRGALQGFLPGIVVQRNLLDAAAAQYAQNGYTRLTQAQAIACLTAANSLDEVTLATPADGQGDPVTQAPYPAAPPAPIALDGSFAGTATGYAVPLVLMTVPRFADSNPPPKQGLSGRGDRRVVGG